jgi:type IX secretion system PorP/SprF family membrane protein
MKKNILFGAMLFCCYLTEAQTYHFSQFYSTPLLVNPAETGFTPGPFRLATNYRSQWNAGGSPYTTFTLSGDAHIMQNTLPEGNTFGLGAVLLNDKTMDGAVQTNTVGFSAGYHISLDADQFQTLGLGFQGTYNERRTDFSRLQFENQFENGGFNPALPIGEDLQEGKKHYFDLNVGGIYSFALEDRSMFAGIAAYNLLKKDESYLTEQFKAPTLYSVIAGGDIDVGINNSFYFSGNYRQQANNKELTIGMAYGFFLDAEGYSVLKLGLWHRLKDALIPYAGLTYKGIQVGASFDYTVSGAKTQSQIRNTFEISLLYLAPDQRELRRLIPWY